jgi:serine/threonine-protein kinase RsbW
VLGSLAPYGLGESDVFDIKLCVEEAVINAIIHGNRRDAKKSVTAAYWINGDELNVEVEDEGDGFVYKEISDPTAEGNIMKSSGRGVYLINHLMDKVEYNDAGNRIRMIKRLRHKKGN